jgi:hypothetical protein
MRASVSFTIAIVASLLQCAPSIAADNCAIGVAAIGTCQMAPKPKPIVVHPRHRARAMEKAR